VTVRPTPDLSAWKAFAPFHYKSHALGIVDRLFVIELDGQAVGVAALGYPTGGLRLRNHVTRGRYSGTRLTRGARLRLLNREVRTITRVVLRPEFRGCGLATVLVRQVLQQAGVPYVEALAAMGQVNRFFERAGMTRIGKVRRGPLHRKLATAFLLAGADQSDLCDPNRLEALMTGTTPERRATIERALADFYRSLSTKRKRPAFDRRRALKRAAATLTAEPVYYFWAGNGKSQHNDTTTTTREGRGERSADFAD